jgi:transposase-like protein
VGRTRPPGRPYLPEEDEAIRRWAGWNGDLIALADRLGRTPDALRLRARALGVYDPPRRHRWTEWEDAVVRDGYTSGLPCPGISHQLSHRSPASVAARARKLGLVSYARRWSTQDERRLVQLTLTGSTIEHVAEKLNRTPEAIRQRAARLRITPPVRAWAPRDRRHWTPAEDELLRLHRALNPARLAQLLGRSDGAVCLRLRALGLRAAAARSPHHPVSRRNGAGGQTERLQAGPGPLSRRVLAAGPRGRPRAQV